MRAHPLAIAGVGGISCSEIRAIARRIGGRTFGRARASQTHSEGQRAMDDALRKQIEDTLSQHKVVLFMKGSKQFPMCGFSGQVVQILNKLGVSYTTVNVLDDPAIRQGMKEFSDWPTFPQLYVEKKFVGGADIVRDMFTSGELQKLVGASG
jgi:monothiol glutaredoxin